MDQKRRRRRSDMKRESGEEEKRRERREVEMCDEGEKVKISFNLGLNIGTC